MSIPAWVWGQSVMWLLAHIYLWARLVRSTTPPGSRARRVGTVLAVVLAGFIPAALITPFFLDIAVSRWIAWPTNIWYGLAVYLLILLILAEPVRLAAAVTREHRAKVSPEAQDPQRRTFLARSIAVTAGAAATGIVGYGRVTALSPPRLDHVTVRLRRGGAQAHGLRIALVGDIHLGPMLGRAHTRRIVDMINRTDADLVAIVGDLVDGTVEQLASAPEPPGHPAGPPADPGERGDAARRGPPTVRAHPRRPDDPAEPAHLMGAADARRTRTLRRHAALRDQRSGILGTAGPGRRASGHHDRGTRHLTAPVSSDRPSPG
ncbi:hypothetical protein [Nonomuraea endophytica]|uniref:Calcineurin-like phosphoesterase domain-containing protein n=1 Tax=Nonomuraea endophytica TaxID=714136 RepID=A0A7W8EM63_9ACTN|nr:hypothetical protein [Nonomuraea endophytica]MBB5084083.1 hypothetical protein [Nonomuraea endophytica]